MNTRASFKPGSEITYKTVDNVGDRLYRSLMSDRLEVFRIDLSDVAVCDSAGLALLIEAQKWCNKHQKQLLLEGMPKDTESLAEFCGVKGILC